MKKQPFQLLKKSISAALTLSALATLTLFASCSEDEEAGPSVNFIDQNIQGTVDGESWTFQTGTAEDMIDGIRILLSDQFYADPCAEFSIQPVIQFQVFDKKTGSITTKNGFSANFIGVGFVTGGLEITSISSTSLSGRADVTYTDDETGVTSEINGNFTVDYCN